MSFIETDLGFEYKTENILVFFGKNTATLEQIKQKYRAIEFRLITQKHTDICVRSTVHSLDDLADAHYSDEANIGLVVKTADCIPLLAYCQKTNLIIAIHAGWRGVENQITLKTLSSLTLKNLRIFIGPHIQQNSFEVDYDVKSLLEEAYNKTANYKDTGAFLECDNKYYINLKTILISQITTLNIPNTIVDLNLDTVLDFRFHSYRRDKQNSGRNLSFIARLKS